MNAQSTFIQQLKNRGYSVTGPRQTVFDALQHHKSLTMRELVATCTASNRASVYRTVALFESIGIVVRIPTGWKYRLELGEAFHEHHHHATCLSCGASIALPEDTRLEHRLGELARQRNFVLVSHQIELGGRCQICAQQHPAQS